MRTNQEPPNEPNMATPVPLRLLILSRCWPWTTSSLTIPLAALSSSESNNSMAEYTGLGFPASWAICCWESLPGSKLLINHEKGIVTIKMGYSPSSWINLNVYSLLIKLSTINEFLTMTEHYPNDLEPSFLWIYRVFPPHVPFSCVHQLRQARKHQGSQECDWPARCQ